MAEEDSQQMKLGFTQMSFLTWLLHMNQNLSSWVKCVTAVSGDAFLQKVIDLMWTSLHD